MNAFTFDHDNSTITVTPLGQCRFKVEIPGKKMMLLLKQDNEGADHWFEDGTDNETPETKAIGTAIDNYMAKHDTLPMPDPY